MKREKRNARAFASLICSRAYFVRVFVLDTFLDIFCLSIATFHSKYSKLHFWIYLNFNIKWQLLIIINIYITYIIHKPYSHHWVCAEFVDENTHKHREHLTSCIYMQTNIFMVIWVLNIAYVCVCVRQRVCEFRIMYVLIMPLLLASCFFDFLFCSIISFPSRPILNELKRMFVLSIEVCDLFVYNFQTYLHMCTEYLAVKCVEKLNRDVRIIY